VNASESTQFFPPLADPALWQSFQNNRPKGLDAGRDDWNRDELYGDRILAVASTSLFQRYNLPYLRCKWLTDVLLSNKYFCEASRILNLKKHLFHPSGKKTPADAFEVWVLSYKLLI
jgi:hypothetical protein